MAQEWAKQFYRSKHWIRCRNGYVQKMHGLCERCYKLGEYIPGVIVHHKIVLTPNNILDPQVSLNHDNLELLCLDCHNKEHMSRGGAVRSDVMFDNDGRLIKR